MDEEWRRYINKIVMTPISVTKQDYNSFCRGLDHDEKVKTDFLSGIFFVVFKSHDSYYTGYHKIVHFACARSFSVFRNRTYSTLLEPTNFSREARNHTFSTLYGSKVY